ncbi:putative phosphoglycerate mutase [Pseudonocardia eucalypti]|uniref:histidine phosphatase family protein n=1 Tax=Pseudonocardia eucalypti TaxID=648755 RepID=UPI00161B02B3|nr:putative phosphoglycerate mutase [Pseudonocardia eucalypti]
MSAPVSGDGRYGEHRRSRPAEPLLVLVRHGQTRSNVVTALDTLPPGPPLTEIGLAQAERVADALAGEPVGAVYSSIAVRARQTAAPIAARHSLPARQVEGVHELFCGDLEGRTDQAALEELHDVVRSWAAGDLGRPVPGGESAADLHARYLPAVERIWHEHPGGLLVLVSHGLAMRVAVSAMIGEASDDRPVPNTGRIVLAPSGTPGGWLLKFWEAAEAPTDPTGNP